MLNNILIATDLSQNSDSALKRASLIAEQCSAELHILHVIEPSTHKRLTDYLQNETAASEDSIDDKARHLLTDKAKALINHDAEVSCHVTTGQTDIGILDYADEHNIDLIVLGAHGYHYFHNWYLGSTAENVLRLSKCPSLIVKQPAAQYYRNIINAVDFTDAGRHMLDFSLRFLPKADHTALHVANAWYEDALFEYELPWDRQHTLLEQMTDELKQKMARFLDNFTDYSVQPASTIKAGYPTKVLSEHIEQNHNDLVVIGTHGHPGYYYFILGSVANRLLHELTTDMLMVPYQGEQVAA